jgi:hypothetical protein
MALTRRQILAGAAATAACAAVPAAAIAELAEKAPAWSMTFPDWTPGRFYSVGEVVRIGGGLHRVMVPHYGDDEPCDYFAGLA